MNHLAKKLYILTPDGWYKVSKCDMLEHGGAVLLDRYNGSLVKMITTVFHEYPLANILVSSFCLQRLWINVHMSDDE